MASFYSPHSKHIKQCLEKGQKVEPVPKISVSGCKFSFGVSHSWQFLADKTGTAFGGELEGSDMWREYKRCWMYCRKTLQKYVETTE